MRKNKKKEVAMEKIKLGDKVKDRISGFTGIYTAKTVYLNKCIRCLITAQKVIEGKVTTCWIDEDDVIKIDNGIYKGRSPLPTGGSRCDNPARKDAEGR